MSYKVLDATDEYRYGTGFTSEGNNITPTLYRGLATLAPWNNLRTLTIDIWAGFDESPFRQSLVKKLLYSSRVLLDAILQLRGIQEFRCEPAALIRETDPEIWEAFQDFKAKMETQPIRIFESETAANHEKDARADRWECKEVLR